MASAGRYADLDRPPLSERALAAALVRPGALWTSLRVVTRTGSTNADLAAEGVAAGTVLVAELQTAGRGRVDRSWASPAQSGLTFSLLLRPPVPAARWGWLPLLAGVALADAVVRVGELTVALKWPNDLLLGADARKGGGILARVTGDAVVIGIGLNVSTRSEELPPGAGSLATEGAARTDRDPLLRAVLRSLDLGYRRWVDAGGDAEACGLAAGYRAHCATLGRQVRVTLPGPPPPPRSRRYGASESVQLPRYLLDRAAGREEERVLAGLAEDVDADGRLVVVADGTRHAVAAGDVTHVRPA